MNSNDMADNFCQTGLVDYQNRDFKAAKINFMKALEVEPKHLNAHFNLAILHKELKEYSEAIRHFKIVLDFDSKDLESKHLLEECELSLKQNSEVKVIQTLVTNEKTPEIMTSAEITKAINKLADLQDLHNLSKRAIIDRIFLTKKLLENKKISFSNDFSSHWLKIWESSHFIIESDIDARMEVLEINGANSLFSYFLATENCKVWNTQSNESLVNSARENNRKLNLEIKSSVQNPTNSVFRNESFDRIFWFDGLEENQEETLKEFHRILRKGGIFAFSFDFGTGSKFFKSVEIAENFFQKLEGFEVFGNRKFQTQVNDYGSLSGSLTKGIIFLRKKGATKLPNLRQLSFGAFPAFQDLK